MQLVHVLTGLFAAIALATSDAKYHQGTPNYISERTKRAIDLGLLPRAILAERGQCLNCGPDNDVACCVPNNGCHPTCQGPDGTCTEYCSRDIFKA